MNSPDTQQPAVQFSHVLMSCTAKIIGDFLRETKVSPIELPGLVASVRTSLAGETPQALEPPKLPDGVTIENSVQPDHLVSLITGQKFQSLKRHLRTHDMTPASYRDRFGLPPDYPMTCASYSETRSTLAKNMGLGQQRKAAPAASATAPAATTTKARPTAKADGGTTMRTRDSVVQTETEGSSKTSRNRKLATAA